MAPCFATPSAAMQLNGTRSSALRDFVLWMQVTCADAWTGNQLSLVSKGGDPAAPSDTATLLRLHPSHRPHRGKRPPCGSATCFWCNKLPWCDGRCVQGPGTYSPRHSDSRLLAIPTSRSRVADCDPDYDRF